MERLVNLTPPLVVKDIFVKFLRAYDEFDRATTTAAAAEEAQDEEGGEDEEDEGEGEAPPAANGTASAVATDHVSAPAPSATASSTMSAPVLDARSPLRAIFQRKTGKTPSFIQEFFANHILPLTWRKYFEFL